MLCTQVAIDSTDSMVSAQSRLQAPEIELGCFQPKWWGRNGNSTHMKRHLIILFDYQRNGFRQSTMDFASRIGGGIANKSRATLDSWNFPRRKGWIWSKKNGDTLQTKKIGGQQKLAYLLWRSNMAGKKAFQRKTDLHSCLLAKGCFCLLMNWGYTIFDSKYCPFESLGEVCSPLIKQVHKLIYIISIYIYVQETAIALH